MDLKLLFCFVMFIFGLISTTGKNSDYVLVSQNPVDIISVKPPTGLLTNAAAYRTSGYHFPVQFSNNHGKIKSSTGDGKVVLTYDCKVDPPYVGYARPWTDFVTDDSYCLFFPYSPEHLIRFTHRLGDMSPYVYLSISASLRDADHICGSASATFIGGFSILELDKGSMQINLSPALDRTVITISGNTDVEIQWREQDLMDVKLIDKEGFGMRGRAQYEVKALKATRFKDKIIITLPATGQQVEVDVFYESTSQTSSMTSFSAAAMVGTFMIITLPLVLLSFFYERSNKPKPLSNKPKPFASPSAYESPYPVATLYPPLRTSERRGLVQTGLSRRLPEPYIEYLWSTLDETPYYCRGAWRRPVPCKQNTTLVEWGSPMTTELFHRTW